MRCESDSQLFPHPPFDVRDVGPEVPVHRHIREPGKVQPKDVGEILRDLKEAVLEFPGNKDRFLNYMQDTEVATEEDYVSIATI